MRYLLLVVVMFCLLTVAGCGSGSKGHPCTCGCEKTGQCTCPNCNTGCGFCCEGAKK